MKKVRSLYEISGIIDRMLEGELGLEDDILGTLTEIDSRIDALSRKVANLERYARKLKASITGLVRDGKSNVQGSQGG